MVTLDGMVLQAVHVSFHCRDIHCYNRKGKNNNFFYCTYAIHYKSEKCVLVKVQVHGSCL